MEDIAAELRKLKFRHRLFGGVDEDDVWVKLRTMQEEYRHVVEITEERCDALLLEREEEIRQLQDTEAELRNRLKQCERTEENDGGKEDEQDG
jgi:vacuolar-type H+-ATPase subunit I/STV1